MEGLTKNRKNITNGGMEVPQNNDHLDFNLLATENEVVDTRPPWFDASDILKNRTPKQRSFLKRAIKINSTDNWFTVKDFPDLKKPNFRKTIERLNDVVICETRGEVGRYRVKGVPMYGNRRKILADSTLGDSVYSHLVTMSVAPSGIHDIMLEFKSNLLHQKLKARGKKLLPSNSLIKDGMHLGEYLYAKIHVYTKTVNIHIKSTLKPFGCDQNGMDKLIIYANRIYERLFLLCDEESDFPPPDMWILKLCHFAKDGRTYTGERFEVKFNEFVGGMVRFYIKDWPDGRRPRIEQISTPNRPLKEIIEQKFSSQENNLNDTIQRLQKEEAGRVMLEEYRKNSAIVEKISTALLVN